MVLLRKLLNSCYDDETFFSIRENFSFFHTVELVKISQKKIRQINSLVTYFSKTITFTKYLPKMLEREIPQFPHCGVYKSFVHVSLENRLGDWLTD